MIGNGSLLQNNLCKDIIRSDGGGSLWLIIHHQMLFKVYHGSGILYTHTLAKPCRMI